MTGLILTQWSWDGWDFQPKCFDITLEEDSTQSTFPTIRFIKRTLTKQFLSCNIVFLFFKIKKFISNLKAASLSKKKFCETYAIRWWIKVCIHWRKALSNFLEQYLNSHLKILFYSGQLEEKRAIVRSFFPKCILCYFFNKKFTFSIMKCYCSKI